jgi:DNA-directed RNA polymerase subunit beta'
LADTALKTADSGYLTRKLADVAQNVVITMDDCGTTQGITKGVIYRGEKVEVSLADAIRGRVSRQNIVNPITDEVIVARTNDHARNRPQDRRTGPGEDPGPQPDDVRRARWVSAACCYGMDLSTGAMVEEGMAVGIIAAQSIGEPGTQLTMRTFHIGGTVATRVEESEIAPRRAVSSASPACGRHQRRRPKVVLTRNGEIAILDAKGRELEKYESRWVPPGRRRRSQAGDVLCQWDPHRIPILAEVGGKVRFEDVVEGETMRLEKDPGGTSAADHRPQGRSAPADRLEDADGKPLDVYYLPEKGPHRSRRRRRGSRPVRGLAKTPREASGIRTSPVVCRV